MRTNMVCYCLIFLLYVVSDVCWSKNMVEPAEVFTILNVSRESIKSGELRVMSDHVQIRPSQSIPSVEDIKVALEEAWLPNGLGYEDEIVSYMRRKEWEAQREECVVFEVNTSLTTFQY